MFEGSANYNSEYFKRFSKPAGMVNGSTSNDRTNYYEASPPTSLNWPCGWKPTAWPAPSRH